jgi:hypothetical protein
VVGGTESASEMSSISCSVTKGHRVLELSPMGFSLSSPLSCGGDLPLNIELIGASPLLVTGYPLCASKEMLTKHSQFNRIAPIKIIRAAPSQEAVKV